MRRALVLVLLACGTPAPTPDAGTGGGHAGGAAGGSAGGHGGSGASAGGQGGGADPGLIVTLKYSYWDPTFTCPPDPVPQTCQQTVQMFSSKYETVIAAPGFSMCAKSSPTSSTRLIDCTVDVCGSTDFTCMDGGAVPFKQWYCDHFPDTPVDACGWTP